MAAGFPDWQRAVSRAQAPQLPAAQPAPPAEERFNQTHAYHGEFGTSGGTEKAPGKAPAKAGSAAKPAPTKAERKQALLQQAAQDRQQAATLRGQLTTVQQQIAYYNQPYKPSPSSKTATNATAKGSSKASGTPSKSAAASGTKSYGKGGKGTKGGFGYNATKPSGQSYIQGLYSQEATLRGQIATLEQQANVLTRRANRL